MYELSFAPEFFIGPHDLDGVALPSSRPTSLYQAICAMPEDEWERMAFDVFNADPAYLTPGTVFTFACETDTCTDLRSPVEVWIDPEGFFRVRVYGE